MKISMLGRLRSIKNNSRSIVLLLIALTGFIFSGTSYSQSPTLIEIKKRGSVICGVHAGLKGFALPNSLGDYSGLDSDFCRAVASAIFNDPTAVEFVALDNAARFTALQEKRIRLHGTQAFGHS